MSPGIQAQQPDPSHSHLSAYASGPWAPSCSSGSGLFDFAQRFLWLGFGFLFFLSGPALGQEEFRPDLTIATEHYRHGRYDECLKHASAAVEDGIWNERWYLLKINVDLTLGHYESAKETLEAGMQRYTSSIQLRWLGRDVLTRCGESERAESMLQSIAEMAENSPWRYSDRPNRIVIGKFLLEQGSDPRRVLETFFDRIKTRYPDYIDAYLAIADVALEKRDFQVASEELQAAEQRDGDNAEIQWRLAVAFSNSDAERAQAALNRCLQINPHFIPALLTVVDEAIDGERYDIAKEHLNKIESINPREPQLWSYRAVLAHLGQDATPAETHRAQALKDWTDNPEVDFIIGRKLSQKYRFREGAEHQRAALAFDADYLPAKVQLSQDLLRIGNEDEGWALVKAIQDQDKYNVVAYNLSELANSLAQFETLEAPGLLIRMDRREAELYGDEVVSLLQECQNTLNSKYDVELEGPVLVEIFPRQADFAIRTFGLPGGSGYLGVCFGTLITVNGPAAQEGSLTNWRSILWHEYCHAVTLTKTRHRMPRWLSEGLSVYEERQKDPGWGQWMNSTYRTWILEGELTPVSQLSEAFLRPQSGAHLDFAYYESSLVIEYLIETKGLAAVLRLLDDLATGLSMEEALTRSWGASDFIDREFESFARALAENYGNDWDWNSLDEETQGLSAAQLQDLASKSPKQVSLQLALAGALISEEQFSEADVLFRELDKKLPEDHSLGSWRNAWAQVLYRLGNQTEELRVLESLTRNNASNEAAMKRLIEIQLQEEQWDLATATIDRLLGVNPLDRSVHEWASSVAQQTDQRENAIRSLRRLLLYPTTNRATISYQLAQQHIMEQNWQAAHQALLDTLEEAPRFREAYVLYDEVLDHLSNSSGESDKDSNDQ
jgi:predicted Zn-dependent protease